MIGVLFMLSGKQLKMKPDRLRKRILIILLTLCIIMPAGILLPMYFNAGNGWGEWSARTMNDLIGYVPEGLKKYTALWNAPLSEYSINSGDKSPVHQSGYYIVSGIIGATAVYLVTIILSRIIVRKRK